MGSSLVYARIDGQPAPWVQERCLTFTMLDKSPAKKSGGKKKGKAQRDEVTLVLEDRDRDLETLLLTLLDTTWEFQFGWPGRMSRPRQFRFKEYEPPRSVDLGQIELKFQATSGGKNTSEMHRTRAPRRWGRVSSSAIAASIATRHGLALAAEPSDDGDEPIVQAADESDYALLSRLADDLGYEFFVDNGILYFRQPPEGEAPRGILTFLPNADDGLVFFSAPQKIVPARVRALSAGTERPDPPTTAATEGAPTEPTIDPIEDAQAQVTAATASASAAHQQALQAPEDVEKAVANVVARQALEEARQKLQQAKAGVKTDAKAAAPKTWAASAAPPPTSSQVSCKAAKGAGKAADVGGTPEPGGYLELGLSGDRSWRIVPEAEPEATVSTPASSPRTRERRACAAQRDLINRGREATARVVMDPRIQAKVNYEIRNVGAASGIWYVTEASHTVAGAEHVCEMKLRLGRAPEGKKKAKPGATGAGGAEDHTHETMLVLDVTGKRTFRFESTRVPSAK